MPLKVAILTSSFLPTVGGTQYKLKWFLDNLDRRLNDRHDVQASFAYPNRNAEPYARFDNITAFDLQLADHRRASLARMLVRLGGFLRRTRPDVIDCRSLMPDALWTLIASRMFGVRSGVVAGSEGGDIVWLPQWSFGRPRRGRSRVVIRQVTRRIAVHVVPSRAMLEFAAASGTPMERTVVVPGGIPMGNDHDFEEEDSTSDKDVSVPRNRDGMNILCLSSGRGVKNLRTLVEAFAMARPRIGASRLLLACRGSLAQPIARLVEKGGLDQEVDFIGEVSGRTKQAYFRASDVYCLPSHFESFGLVALEAMKWRVPVVAGRVGGIPEYITDGENGLLVSPSDKQNLAAALVRLYEDGALRSRLIENGRRTAERFSISRYADEMLALYERVARGASPQGAG